MTSGESTSLPPGELRTPSLGGRWRPWVVLALVWTLLALISTVRLYYLYNFDNPGYMAFGQALALALADWYVWAALTPAIYLAVSRLESRPRLWISRLALHLALALGFSLLRVSLHALTLDLVRHWFSIPVVRSLPEFTALWAYLLRSDLLPDLMTYLLIASASFAVNYYRRHRDQERRLAEAEARLAEARLNALRGQLQPHFLFNTLNAITALIHVDPAAADRMVARLSDLLRMTLEFGDTRIIPLRREIQFIRSYLEIQRTRFADRLRVSIEIPDCLMNAAVPALVLQPLVENAVRHGIAPRSAPGHIRVTAAADTDRLTLRVTDNGAGLPPTWTGRADFGRGLANTRDRLAALYSTHATLDIRPADGGGVVASIELPLRSADPERKP